MTTQAPPPIPTSQARTSPPVYPLEKNFTKHPRIIACLLIIASVCMFVLASAELHALSRAFLSGMHAPGTITQVKTNSWPRSNTFEYTVEYRSDTSAVQTGVITLAQVYQTGEPLSIVYIPGKPKVVYQANAFLAQASFGLGFLALSLFIGIFGINELGKAFPARSRLSPIALLLAFNKAILPIALLITVALYLVGKSAG